eukprot:COSAG01_NODE_12252_length_1773_cov_1.633214_2_plen_60_part_00
MAQDPRAFQASIDAHAQELTRAIHAAGEGAAGGGEEEEEAQGRGVAAVAAAAAALGCRR